MRPMSAADPACGRGGASALWQEGWYRCARQLRSPNFSARPPEVRLDLIVIHSISLPPGEFANGNVQALFTNQLDWNAHPYFAAIKGLEVSAHFFISRLGELWQFVSCDSKAWHAGQSVFRGRKHCNDYSVGIELEGLEGDSFEQMQYETLAALCTAISGHYPIKHVTGHEQVSVGRKFDPGAQFNWPHLNDALGSAPGCSPANP
jgi:N-acetyl-anhydromuramoyl-L-alanine amidase